MYYSSSCRSIYFNVKPLTLADRVRTTGTFDPTTSHINSASSKYPCQQKKDKPHTIKVK